MSINQKRIDPRVIRTRQMLRDALIKLLQERSFESIKVKDITDCATLNKATFYLHYSDKEDLLVRSTYEAIEELEIEIGSPIKSIEEMTPLFLLQLVTIVFNHFAKHDTFYRVILNQIGTPPVITAMQIPIERIIHRWIMQLKQNDTESMVDLNFVIQFVSSGFIGLVRGWLNQPKPSEPEYMAHQLLNVIVLGIFRSVGLPNPVLP